jgi:hypothetical protein
VGDEEINGNRQTASQGAHRKRTGRGN